MATYQKKRPKLTQKKPRVVRPTHVDSTDTFPVPGDPGEPITGGPKGLSAREVDVYRISTESAKPRDITVRIIAHTKTSQLRVTLIGSEGTLSKIATFSNPAVLTAVGTELATLDVRSDTAESTYIGTAFALAELKVDPPPPVD